MNIQELNNGFFRLTSENGILDTRNNEVYSEVVTKEKNIRYFKSVDTETTV